MRLLDSSLWCILHFSFCVLLHPSLLDIISILSVCLCIFITNFFLLNSVAYLCSSPYLFSILHTLSSLAVSVFAALFLHILNYTYVCLLLLHCLSPPVRPSYCTVADEYLVSSLTDLCTVATSFSLSSSPSMWCIYRLIVISPRPLTPRPVHTNTDEPKVPSVWWYPRERHQRPCLYVYKKMCG